MIDKQTLRKWAKEERKKLNMPELSEKLALRLKNTKEYKSSKNIIIFYPLLHEVNLLSLLKDKTKTFYLPKIEGENLVCCPYNEGDSTCLSCFNTCEPASEPCDKSLIDLAVVPALAVDKNYYRLGYGGGFYDRFLKDFNGITIVCIPKQFVVDNIYPEKHDIPVNLIITEEDGI